MNVSIPPALPTVADVRRAAERLAGLALPTPLLSHPLLDEMTGGRILLKCENLQRTGSFKFRGAYNAIASLEPKVRAQGIVAVSSGNHAQGVAEAARHLGVSATIVMPTDAPAMKRARTFRSGARIVDYDRASEDREAVAARLLAEKGGTLIHPFDNPQVIAGQGTVGLEVVSAAVGLGITPETILVPCGGGGLSSGIGLAVREAWPEVEIVLIEPEGFDDYGRSLKTGEILANAAASGSVCDGLLSLSPGQIGFALNRAHLARAMTVSDTEALAAVAFAFKDLKQVVEPSGAVALAALLSGRFDARGRTVVLVVSGGNIDAELLNRALETI
jgi:threonine dehydratase